MQGGLRDVSGLGAAGAACQRAEIETEMALAGTQHAARGRRSRHQPRRRKDGRRIGSRGAASQFFGFLGSANRKRDEARP